MNQATIAGVDLEAVRELTPIPHWRVKVVRTGFVYDAGCFKSESRPKMWASVEYTAQRLGEERFRNEMLNA